MSEKWKVEDVEGDPKYAGINIILDDEIICRVFDNKRAVLVDRASLIAAAPQMREALTKIKELSINGCKVNSNVMTDLNEILSGVDFGAG